jgi:O-antigen/teichoic acid export membrane protein
MMRIFGPAFEPGWPVLVIGSVGQIVNCSVGSVGLLLFMSGNQRRLMKVQFVMVGVSLLMNIALIPVFGVVGAALAAASVNVGGNVWNLLEVRKALGISPYNRSYAGLAIPALFSIGAAVIVKLYIGRATQPWLGILAALLVSYVVFAFFALKFSLVDDDRMIFASAWAQVRSNFVRR